MIFSQKMLPFLPTLPITSLGEAQVQDMLTLTGLTEPGPFLPRTVEFGHYEGIYQDELLVAMAGLRLHTGNFVEISAVCTHPNYVGKGYAKELMLSQISHLQQSGKIPYLHVRTTNTRALQLYEHIGFSNRKSIHVYGITKKA